MVALASGFIICRGVSITAPIVGEVDPRSASLY